MPPANPEAWSVGGKAVPFYLHAGFKGLQTLFTFCRLTDSIVAFKGFQVEYRSVRSPIQLCICKKGKCAVYDHHQPPNYVITNHGPIERQDIGNGPRFINVNPPQNSAEQDALLGWKLGFVSILLISTP